jgi:hypothetical protein
MSNLSDTSPSAAKGVADDPTTPFAALGDVPPYAESHQVIVLQTLGGARLHYYVEDQ